MSKTIQFKGTPLTLVGRRITPGDSAPDFRVVSADSKETTLADFGSKIKVITTFPSLDTPVCDLQVKEFNKKALEFSSDIVVLGISKDLPFAQKRFCSENEIKNVSVLSDYKYSSFGINYGLLIKEMNLLARSVLIIDKNNIVRYARIVEELSTPPDYEDALKNLKEVMNNPGLAKTEGLPAKCKPCEGGVQALPKEQIEKLLAQVRGWQLVEDPVKGARIVKEFKFSDFAQAKYFLDLVSVIVEEQGHHPVLTLINNKLKITLTTHAANGLTENDFIMAGIMDGLEE